jgi:alkylation response protein AidB-like acyl-CoA dehydrogenase
LLYADLVISAEVGRMLTYRVLSMVMSGRIPNSESSAAKLFNSEVGQRMSYFGLNMAGLNGQLMEGDQSWLAYSYCGAIAATIGGGTSEVQRSIMATRGLGLPRG